MHGRVAAAVWRVLALRPQRCRALPCSSAVPASPVFIPSAVPAEQILEETLGAEAGGTRRPCGRVEVSATVWVVKGWCRGRDGIAGVARARATGAGSGPEHTHDLGEQALLVGVWV